MYKAGVIATIAAEPEAFAAIHKAKTCNAQSVHVPSLGSYLVRGCLESPQQQGVLCPMHAAWRSQPHLLGEIAKQKLVHSLTDGGFCGLQVQITDVASRWQPAGWRNRRVLRDETNKTFIQNSTSRRLVLRVGKDKVCLQNA